jgi:hypothetical protein
MKGMKIFMKFNLIESHNVDYVAHDIEINQHLLDFIINEMANMYDATIVDLTVEEVEAVLRYKPTRFDDYQLDCGYMANHLIKEMVFYYAWNFGYMEVADNQCVESYTEVSE